MAAKKAIDPFGWAALALLVVAGVMLITADKLLGGRSASGARLHPGLGED